MARTLWDWDKRGEEVTRALRACELYRRGPRHDEAAARFQAAIDAAWPPGFVEQLERCRRGDPAGLDDVLDFLEAKPRFFRSGYIREKALRFLPRVPRTDAQARRMRELVLGAVDLHHRGSIRRFCSLARAVDAPFLRDALQQRRQHSSGQVRARARCVLDALGAPPWDEEQARARREEQRIRSMVVTVHNRRSAPLARREREAPFPPGPPSRRGGSSGWSQCACSSSCHHLSQTLASEFLCHTPCPLAPPPAPKQTVLSRERD
jgi:hypothetical protein